tara:strand:+ start:363 stop:650 length:288 start_codon:yes stop_codon:yes gene_type:complete
MKTKFKNFLLYSLACVGAVSLFLSATQPEQTTSTVPESHVWEFNTAKVIGGAGGNTIIDQVYTLNKVTGEVRKHSTFSVRKDQKQNQFYQVVTQN